MNKSFAAVLTGATGALIVAGSASAAFTGLTYTKKHDVGGLILSDGTPVWVTNIAAQFDDPGDRLLSIGFGDVSLSGGGAWYQNPFGTDTAPSSAIIGAFPDAAFDSFVTIGLKTDDSATSLDGDWQAAPFAAGDGLVGGWFNSNPDNGQGDAGSYEDLAVLIAQLTIADWSQDSTISGSLTVFWKDASSGEVIASAVDVHKKIPAPGALALLGLAGFAGRRRRA